MDELLTPRDVERLAAEAGMPLRELFVRAGISHTTFYRWRAGKTKPTMDVYERIVDALRSAAAA